MLQPEGPEIKLAADKIAKAIVGQPIVEVFFAFEQGLAAEKVIKVIAVTPKGKALLIRFSNQRSIYSHIEHVS